MAPARRPVADTGGAPGETRPWRSGSGWLSLEIVAVRSGLHPDLVRKFVALSLLDASRDAAGTLWFAPDTPATIARIQRLRAGLCLNYAAVGLVLDLLDRIDTLEASRPPAAGRSTPPWT
jgi:chaperone modulatory protein CbpM